MPFAYRDPGPYHFTEGATRQNEDRADRIELALATYGDKNAETDNEAGARTGAFTDVSDLLASVRHFCDRAGLDYGRVDAHAYTAYRGDVAEDGGAVQRDHERFPED